MSFQFKVLFSGFSTLFLVGALFPVPFSKSSFSNRVGVSKSFGNLLIVYSSIHCLYRNKKTLVLLPSLPYVARN